MHGCNSLQVWLGHSYHSSFRFVWLLCEGKNAHFDNPLESFGSWVWGASWLIVGVVKMTDPCLPGMPLHT